jgi:hypothetical protein
MTSELTCGFPSGGPAGLVIVALLLPGAVTGGGVTAFVVGGLANGAVLIVVSVLGLGCGLTAGLPSTGLRDARAAGRGRGKGGGSTAVGTAEAGAG